MIVYNTTFQVDMADAKNLVVYLHEAYMPQAQASGVMRNGRMCRIISHRDADSECFSVQFECDSVGQIHKWYTADGQRLHNELLKVFKNKVVGFPTMMEVIE